MPHISDDVTVLKKELVGLFGHIQRIRKELAAISQPSEDTDHFNSMTDQLDAIVQATESATNTIMESMEEIGDLVTKVQARTTDAESRGMLGNITDRTNAVFEACSFQDITGQRVTKVVNSLKFIEERVNALIFMWGKDELAKVVVEIREDKDDPDKKLLNGPQLQGHGVSQAEVDKLFSQDDIDKLFG